MSARLRVVKVHMKALNGRMKVGLKLRLKVRSLARTEVVRRLRIDESLLELLEEEEIVLGRRGRYTPADLDRIRIAAELQELGVNAAGIDVFLRMRQHWQQERAELVQLVEALRARLKS